MAGRRWNAPGPAQEALAPMRTKRSPHEGIEVRHSRSCESRRDRECNCRPAYQASVWSKREGKRIRKTFPTLAAARSWRADAQVSVRKGTLRAPTRQTLCEAAGAWLTGARNGTIRNRSGDRFKPSTLRGYESALRLHLLPTLGGLRLSDLERNDLQDLVDRMLGQGADPSTIRNALMPLRAICGRAVSRADIAVNPTGGLRLPAVRGCRDRIATPTEAAALLDALPLLDRPLWATALYAGLRLGELQALRWEDLDLAAGVIRVERSWDPRVGPIEPKSRSGRRAVPIAAVLRDYLVEHRMRAKNPEGLVFARADCRPPDPSTVNARARRAWDSAGVDRITLHEARHTFASLMIAAGVNVKALSTYMGHSSITITLDRYGHLMPGNETEAAGLLDAYLECATEGDRSASAAA
jgi:integrase